jgi:glycine cleavage system H lipoate-binding protein
MCLIILAISYLRGREEDPLTAAQTPARGSPLVPGSPLEIPEGHCFHPCHTWLAREGGENARVGIDSFAASLFGEIEHIEVTHPNRWVRQGQRLMTMSIAGVSVELVSPVEGTVKELNEIALRDPALVVSDPYRGGWIALLKSSDITINQKNLLQGPMVKLWLRNSLARLNEMVSQLSPALAQDGGVPVQGLLWRVSPELQRKLVKEFFLMDPIPRAQALSE